MEGSILFLVRLLSISCVIIIIDWRSLNRDANFESNEKSFDSQVLTSLRLSQRRTVQETESKYMFRQVRRRTKGKESGM